MKITIYELLGMIKDGKAPKKVKWKNNIYTYVYDDDREENIINYYCDLERHIHLIDGGQHDIRLNDEVEILEEEPRDIEVCGSLFTRSEYDKLAHSEEEKKIPEKLEDRARFQYSKIPTWFEKKEIIKVINENFEKHQKAIYELIDYLNSKGE